MDQQDGRTLEAVAPTEDRDTRCSPGQQTLGCRDRTMQTAPADREHQAAQEVYMLLAEACKAASMIDGISPQMRADLRRGRRVGQLIGWGEYELPMIEEPNPSGEALIGDMYDTLVERLPRVPLADPTRPQLVRLAPALARLLRRPLQAVGTRRRAPGGAPEASH